MEKSRSKFALVLTFLRPVTPIVRIGYKNYTRRQTAFNAAMCYNLSKAVDGEYPEYSLNYENVLLSQGTLSSIINGRMVYKDNVIGIAWDYTPQAINDETIFVAVINEDDEEAVFLEKGSTRRSCGQIIHIPKEWSSKTVHVYAGFSHFSDVSNSKYLGFIKIH